MTVRAACCCSCVPVVLHFLPSPPPAAVVPGLQEMIRTMHVGGKRRAVLPPSLGYQTAAMKPTPADVCFCLRVAPHAPNVVPLWILIVCCFGQALLCHIPSSMLCL